MSRVCTWIFLALISVCLALSEKSGYRASAELSNKHSPEEDRLLVNIVRGWNSSKVLDARRNESEVIDKASDKRARTTITGSGSERGSNCCVGARYNTNASVRPDSHYSRIPQDGRVPSSQSQYTPVDRYGWQTQNRPSGSAGNSGRPGAGNYGNNYGGSYGGSSLYATSNSGDRFSTRPTPGIDHFRPGNYGAGGYNYGSGSYGGFGRPTSQGGGGNYGISGTLADGEEFGPGDPGFPEASPPPHPNIQTQKAVALKALAGVALIGAAAALATNPVLLPIGIVAGRRKRSEFYAKHTTDSDIEEMLQLLRTYFPKIHVYRSAGKIIMSPQCSARLTCEIQRNYLNDLEKDMKQLNQEDENSRHYLANLIRSNVLNADTLHKNQKSLIEAGVSVGSTGGDCKVFACSFIKAE